MALVALSFDAWAAGRVGPAVVEVPVVAPKAGVTLEAVSKRLRGELPHPSKTGTVHGVRFSPDGRRIVAMDNATYAIVVWDVASGRAVTTIDTRRDGRVSWDYSLSPDGQTAFTAGGKRDYERLQQDGKQLYRWSFDGEVRAWDLATGQLRRTYRHQEPRNVLNMQLSPSGESVVAFEELSGTYEGRAKIVAGLWDVRTGRYLPLPDGMQFNHYGGLFTPNGRTFVVGAADSDGYTTELKFIDTSTGRERQSVPIPDKHARVFLADVSPDGRLVVGDYRAFEAAKTWDKWQGSFKWWEVDSGREVASIVMEKNDDFSGTRFSPDGKTLAVANGQEDQTTLRLYRTDDKQLTNTIVLGKKSKEERLLVRERVFSPDGKWLAVITQRFPINLGRDLDPRDVPQPRIQVIEVATSEIRETLVAPQSLMSSACFSPDGRTLATGGHGKVLLWDVADIAARR